MSRRMLLIFGVMLLFVPALRADEESDRQAKMEQLKKDYHDWYQNIHDLRRWYDEDTDKIREAICSEDEAKIEETTLNVAGVPLKVTLLAPVSCVPRIRTGAPTNAKVGCAATKGPRPTESTKIVPRL